VQQKTGMLSVATNDKSAVLFFHDGKIISTRDRRSKTRDPFREYLTRYGCLGREDLTRITQMIAQSKLDMVDILHSEGFFDEKTLGRHWRNHIQETLHDVLTWDQCTYKYLSGDDIVAGVKTFGEYSVEPLLMESMRRIDEFPGLLKLFAVQDVRIAATSKTYEGEEPLSENEKLILSIVKTARCALIARQHADLRRTSPELLKRRASSWSTRRRAVPSARHLAGAPSAEARQSALLVAASFVFFACVAVGVAEVGQRRRIARRRAARRPGRARR
jgi:hypothetical protein